MSAPMTSDFTALEELADLVEERRRHLGETAEQAVDATAINVLQSLRADTSTVGRRADVFNGRYYYEIEETGLRAGWARPGRSSPRGRRVIREGAHGAMDTYNGLRVVNKAGNYAMGRNPSVYTLAIYNIDNPKGVPFFPAKVDSVAVIANNVEDVRKYAERVTKGRIQQYRGISKRALGAAMRAFGAASGGDKMSSQLQRLADLVVDVRRVREGFASGEYGVIVADNLPHARQALKSGTPETALKKAANKSAAVINRIGGLDLDEQIQTPFPEVSRGKAIWGASRKSYAKKTSGLYSAARDVLVVI